MNYPKPISDLIECYKRLPGIGEKTAERMALASINFDENTINKFANSLINVKKNIKRCNICNNYCIDDLCEICKDNKRNKSIICVVEEPKNIILFEKTRSYNGVYHVLDGLISPLECINPSDINLESLFKRVDSQEINEIIIAVKPSIEGETTALYILKKLENYDVIISKIAHGIPMGTDIDYIDSMTLEMALDDRKKISKKKNKI